ncbi:MFS transporter [Cellvibrio sp. KY-GH-1]|uniref:MFS transporter n=1 Tax=Cellvibrio sp. KY-GH-1 TaxID=2303332 RepID=UPI00177EB2D9|nr:MFS transporter [Cellvibrio sp. KY-GH-1]
MIQQNAQKLSVVEKVGYSLGDLAANLVFQTFVTFIAYYYTDVYGLAPDKAQWVIGTCGLLGGVVLAPIIGALADRTRTRWGSYRPWILFTSVPFAVLIFLTFSTPNLGETGKLIYAFATLLLLMSLYTSNNLPYSALSGVLTGNMAERNSLSAYRFVAVMVAQFIIQALLRPLVLVMGDGNEAVGFEKVMQIFAIASVICFVITFLTTKERMQPEKSDNSIGQDINDLFHNWPWAVMLFSVVLLFITLALKGGAYVYYFKYYADTQALTQFFNTIGFTQLITTIQGIWPNFKWPTEPDASAFGLFNGAGILMMIVGIGLSKPLADRFGKRNTFGVGLFISTLFILIFFAIPKDAIGLMFTSQILHGFTYGVTIPLLWAMIADVADFSEWKNFRRATGIIFSAMILGLKGGLTIGSSVLVGLLAGYGYQRGLALQADETIDGIRLIVSLYASIPFFAICVLMYFYPINKKMETQIESDLNERRKAAGK